MTKTPKIGHIFRLAAIIDELCNGKETTWEPTTLARLILEHPDSHWTPSTINQMKPSMTPSPELIRVSDRLRAARRSKPPSIKQQALQAIAAIEGDFNTVGDRCDMIRKALETLPDD